MARADSDTPADGTIDIPSQTTGVNMTLWIALYFPQLQLDTLFSGQDNSPLVIIDEHRYCVKQANPAAVEQGITIGMGLGTAAAMCSGLQVHPYKKEIEQQRLYELAQWLYLITSDIVLYPPDRILLRVSNMLSLYTGLDNYWQTLSRHLGQCSLSYQYASGYSPAAATLLACSGFNTVTDQAEILAQEIAAHPVTDTELPPGIIDKLHRVGIRTIQQLTSLPMPELARRFDVDLVNYIGRLLGQFRHPVDFYHPPEQFSLNLPLLYDLDNTQWLEKPLLKLLSRMETFLMLRNQVAYELQLTLEQRDQLRQPLLFTSASGEYLAEKWLRLCRLSMESVRLQGPVQALELRILRQGMATAISEDLFDGQRGKQEALELISTLQAKLGSPQVSKIMMSRDPRPEQATVYGPAVSGGGYQPDHSRLRPSLLLPQPEPLTRKVTLVHGPERLATGWWDGNPVVRDYFIARDHQGRWLWIYRTPEQHWFLHGTFS